VLTRALHVRSLLILAAALACVGPAHAAGAAPVETVPGRVLVRWRSSAKTATVQSARALSVGTLPYRFVRTVNDSANVIETDPTDAATAQLLASLRADPDVEYAEPDYIRHRTALERLTPDDPLFGKQWALPMVHAQEAWVRAQGSAKVVVAVVDTGIVDHAELKKRIIGGYDFITDVTNAGDGNGRDEDYSDPGDATETSSGMHGTHVSGIVAAQANNELGVAGLDWGCQLLIVRVLGVRHGTGADSDIADAIRWAAGLHVDGVADNQNPANVINLSFGGSGYSTTMQEAIRAAVGAGAVVVAAAGNDVSDAAKDSPAGLEGVIAVGAVDPSGTIASYSNFGPVVALMAPGGSPLRNPVTGDSQGVLSTIRLEGAGDTYGELAGTSQAAPFVSATVSLMKGAYPHMTPPEARRILIDTANPSAKCQSPLDPTKPGCGAGLLDVDAAVAKAQLVDANGNFDARLGNVVKGGCSLGGAASGSGVPAWALVAALALWAGVRRRRGVL
jgi:serine protease